MGSVRGHGPDDVGDGDDPRLRRELFTLQSLGVAGSVQLLMMLVHEGGDWSGELDSLCDILGQAHLFGNGACGHLNGLLQICVW